MVRAPWRAPGRAVGARLTMLGQVPDEEWWRAMARDLRIDDAVVWRSWLPHEQMTGLYRAHDALLFPSLHDSSGNVLLEALAQGLPVLCLDLGGPGTIVNDACGRVVSTAGGNENKCVDALADAIEQLARSPTLCHELSEGARRQARRYQWRKQVNRLYEDVARRLEQREIRPVREGRVAEVVEI